MLLAALGERFIERHQWRELSWFFDREREHLNRFTQAGVKVTTYDPMNAGAGTHTGEIANIETTAEVE